MSRNRRTSPCRSDGGQAETTSGPDVRIVVRATPRADRNCIAGLRDDGTLVVRTTAPPVDGAANDAIVRMVAESLGVKSSSVLVESGQRSRDKRLVVRGLDSERLAAWRRTLCPHTVEKGNQHV